MCSIDWFFDEQLQWLLMCCSLDCISSQTAIFYLFKKRLPSIGRSGVYGNFYRKLHNLTVLFTLVMDDDLLDVPGQLLEYSNSKV
jgi:hypothetical protein